MKGQQASIEPMEQEYIVLTRILAEADRLCRTEDPFMLGQYRHLRGRVEALVEMTRPPKKRTAS